MKSFPTFQQAAAAWEQHRPHFEAAGIHLNGAQAYIPDGWGSDINLALDAQPELVTIPNSGVPAMFTTFVDPDVYEILFAPTNGAKIYGEVQKGSWVSTTAMFPVVETTGEVSSYGDFNNNGMAGANANWPQRQNYLFQTIAEYGERQIAMAAEGRINWVSTVDKSAANVLNRFLNQSYFFGILGLQNFGILNDPGLPAPIAPAPKAYGGTAWIVNGQIQATANEVYADIQALYLQLVNQTGGLVDANAKLVLAMSPGSSVALTTTNAFNVNVYDLLRKNFPNIRFETAVQYGEVTSINPVGVTAGNTVQLMVEEIEGQKTGFAAFSEKMRTHPIVREMSAWKKKMSAGTWGAVIRMPIGVAQMVGV